MYGHILAIKLERGEERERELVVDHHGLLCIDCRGHLGDLESESRSVLHSLALLLDSCLRVPADGESELLLSITAFLLSPSLQGLYEKPIYCVSGSRIATANWDLP